MDDALVGLEVKMTVTLRTSFQDDQHLNLLRNTSKQCFYPFTAPVKGLSSIKLRSISKDFSPDFFNDFYTKCILINHLLNT